MSRVSIWIAGIALMAVPGAAQAQVLTFYEKNNCSGKVAFRIIGPRPVAQSCKGGQSNCRGKNDTARSVLVEKPATMKVRLTVYDDPYGGTNDDYSVMTFHSNTRAGTRHCIRSFEADIANPAYDVNWRKKNGLDGKVSFVRTQLYRGDGTQIR